MTSGDRRDGGNIVAVLVTLNDDIELSRHGCVLFFDCKQEAEEKLKSVEGPRLGS
jgi:hypothetical protein